MTNKILILASALFLLIGKTYGQYCTNDKRYTENTIYTLAQIDSTVNVVYGSAKSSTNVTTSLKMDIYYPTNTADPGTGKRPFVLMIHGGGFISGNKLAMRDICMQLARRGFVTATISYRLGHDLSEYSHYKARYRAIQDGHAALRYVVNNANAMRVDTSWIFAGGSSAGAALSLGLVYADPVELDSISLLHNPTAISAQLGNLYTSGNNLTNKYSIKGIFNNWGGVIDSEVDSDEMIPTIAFHGEMDTIVLIDADNSYEHATFNGSRAIHNDLIANNICSELNVVLSGDHGVYIGAETAHRAERASCFFKSLFCNNCTSFYTTAKIPSNCSTLLNSEETILDSSPKVYPNPFETSFRIDNLDGLLEFTVYNCLNQLVYKNKTANGVAQIDLKPGIYFLNVKQVESNKSFTTKLIKK